MINRLGNGSPNPSPSSHISMIAPPCLIQSLSPYSQIFLELTATLPLNRLLTQMERILEINALQKVTKAVVGAARESLVIGES
jgi:hypothetical protein